MSKKEISIYFLTAYLTLLLVLYVRYKYLDLDPKGIVFGLYLNFSGVIITLINWIAVFSKRPNSYPAYLVLIVLSVINIHLSVRFFAYPINLEQYVILLLNLFITSGVIAALILSFRIFKTSKA